MNDPQEALIQYRLARAHETLSEAELLARAGLWHGCVNRLYYACFYAVSTLLLHDGVTASRHAGVRSLFNQRFVRSGRMPRDVARVFNRLLDDRQESDYADFVSFEEQQVRPWIAEAREFIEVVERLLTTAEDRLPG